MATSSNRIGDSDYTELNDNYDSIYETLMAGGVVWITLNYRNGGYPTDDVIRTGDDGYAHFMVTNWYMNYNGLNIVTPDGSRLTFTNGSYTPPAMES